MRSWFTRLLVLAGLTFLLFQANLEFHRIAWGTGVWLGEFSLKWGLAFFAFIAISLFTLVGVSITLWRPHQIQTMFAPCVNIRNRSGNWRWLIAGVVLFAPVWFLQYSSWGIILQGTYLRILIWMVDVFSMGLLLTRGDTLLRWDVFLTSLVLTAGTFALFIPMQGVTDYPFSLGWSEGNRLWDYSILFGRRVYDYPADQTIPVLLDIGRRFVGGIPFLFPGLTITQARLWVALTYIVPFVLCGWLAYRLPRRKFVFWALAGLWAFTFLQQGPIHPPLVLSAILIVLAWGQSLWLSIPLVVIASYFAEVSRWTWMFAPGMWAGMLELSSAGLQNNCLARKDWARAIVVGLAGFIAGYILPFFINAAQNLLLGGQTGGVGGVTAVDVVSEIGSQPLLWYRLLPNATYGNGILLGLLFAVGPLVSVLIYLSIYHWRLNLWQKLSIVLPLLAFLVVGLVVSVKIGGGGDLHNMDMFLIGLLFAGAAAWRNIGKDWIVSEGMSWWMHVLVVLMVAIPAYQPLMSLWPIQFTDIDRLATLTDITNPKELTSLPSKEVTEAALKTIRAEVNLARSEGEILFMDQRQLLAFGYISVPLVPEYDKKVLINNAMSEDDLYFERFYADLAAHRFSLIISSPLRTPIKDSSYQFGEENNAWVKWVANPVLCYYEPRETLKEVMVQLLVPRAGSTDCSLALP